MSDNTYKVAEKATRSRGTVYWRFFLVLAYAGTIFALSSIPGTDLPTIGMNDKLLHAVEFGGFAFLLCRAFRALAPTRSRRLIAVIGIVATIGYGAVDEAHQLLVAQRVADLADLVADGIGTLLAVWGWGKAEYYWPWLR